ncbi:hypothetical protein ACFLTM_03850 [Candidatus Bipolaricaulota bacterium]
MLAVRRLLSVGVLLAGTLCAQADEPFDPLQRAEDDGAGYTISASLTYVPLGAEGFGIDDLGRPYDFVRFDNSWSGALTGTILLDRSWISGFDLAVTRTGARERRYYFDGSDLTLTREVPDDLACTLWQEFRVRPGSLTDPRIRFSFGRPWAYGIAVSSSVVIDPMVLAGSFSFKSRAGDSSSWLALRLAAGFVANLRISLSGSAALSVPTEPTDMPTASMTLSARYALDASSTHEISADVSVFVRGETLVVGMGLGFSTTGGGTDDIRSPPRRPQIDLPAR